MPIQHSDRPEAGYVVAQSHCCGRWEYRVDAIEWPVEIPGGGDGYTFRCRGCEQMVVRPATADLLDALDEEARHLGRRLMATEDAGQHEDSSR